MKTSHNLRPYFGSGVSLLVLTAATSTATLLLSAPSAPAQTPDSRGQSSSYSQRRAVASSASRESSFGQRLSNFFSSSNSARATSSRTQGQSRISSRQLPSSANYSTARSSTQYYTYTPETAVSSSYVPTYTPTQGTPQQVTLTNRAAGRNTVIYQSPRTNDDYGSASSQTNPDPRVLQPGESATVTADGAMYRTNSAGETQYLAESMARGDGSAPSAGYTPPAPSTENPTALREQPKPITPPKALIDRESLPIAKWASTFGRVVSPFPPHHELDVSGLPPGSLARDPATRQIFRLP